MNDIIATILSVTLVSAGVLAEFNLLRLFVNEWREDRHQAAQGRLRSAATRQSPGAAVATANLRRGPIAATLVCGVMPSVAFAQASSTPQAQPTSPNAESTATTPTTPPSTGDQLATSLAATPEIGSAISVQLNFDYTTAYFYRGIIQEDSGLIVQPAARLTLNLHHSDDLKLEAFAGAWNSFHGQKTGASTRGEFTEYWYEADLYAGFTARSGKLSLTASYMFLTSPNEAFEAVQELGFTLALDDSEWLKEWSLKPNATVAIETGADASDGADSDTGVYLELGVAPGFAFDLGTTPVTITFPTSVGLSLSNYYQDVDGNDDTFGFAQVGAKASIPLGKPGRFGAWTLNAGVSALFLGDHTRAYNSGDDTEIIGTVGLQWNF